MKLASGPPKMKGPMKQVFAPTNRCGRGRFARNFVEEGGGNWQFIDGSEKHSHGLPEKWL
jgi:hypothetical protein